MKIKKISLIEAISIWIWGMVWWWIFAVLWEAVILWHSATPIAFLIAWTIAFLTSYSYAKLSVKFPSEGWTIKFISKWFWNNIFSKSINLILWLSYLITISLYTVAFWSYLATFFPQSYHWFFLKHILITIWILIPMLLNMLNTKIVAWFESYIVWIKLSILILVIIFSFKYINTEHFNNIMTIKPSSIIIAWMIIFVAYEWFELIANASTEINNPYKNLPLAYYISVLFVIILYILISIITVWTLNETEIIKSSDYALAQAAKPWLWEIWFKLVAISAILATFSAINATIYWNARLWYSLAINRQLPKAFYKKVWNNSYLWVLIVWGISIILANIINLKAIAIIASAWFLLIFTFVNLSALKLRKQINANIIITLISSILTFLAFNILLLETYKNNPKAILIFIWFILFALLFELTYWTSKDEYINKKNKIIHYFKTNTSKILKNKKQEN